MLIFLVLFGVVTMFGLIYAGYAYYSVKSGKTGRISKIMKIMTTEKSFADTDWWTIKYEKIREVMRFYRPIGDGRFSAPSYKLHYLHRGHISR